jgi:Flp pilus assembly pilin Flp
MTLEDGQNLVEYGLVVSLIAFGCAATMKTLASGINTEFTTVISVLSSAMS